MHESVAKDEWLLTHIDGNKNCASASLMTKIVLSGKDKYRVNDIMHSIYDEFNLYIASE